MRRFFDHDHAVDMGTHALLDQIDNSLGKDVGNSYMLSTSTISSLAWDMDSKRINTR